MNTLTCNDAPIDGVPNKNWDGRAGKPCEGQIEARPSLAGPGTIPRCAGHHAALLKWKNKR